MEWLRKPYVFSTEERLTLAVLVGGFLYALVGAYFPAYFVGFQCPSHRWLGLDCPGCGLTRACVALARFDVGAAWRFNPLSFFVISYALYRLMAILVGAFMGRRLIDAWPLWFLRIYQAAFVLTWLVLLIVRTYSWFFPDANASGIALPPSS